LANYIRRGFFCLKLCAVWLAAGNPRLTAAEVFQHPHRKAFAAPLNLVFSHCKNSVSMIVQTLHFQNKLSICLNIQKSLF